MTNLKKIAKDSDFSGGSVAFWFDSTSLGGYALKLRVPIYGITLKGVEKFANISFN